MSLTRLSTLITRYGLAVEVHLHRLIETVLPSTARLLSNNICGTANDLQIIASKAR